MSGLMLALDVVGKLLSIGSALKNIFGGSTPTLEDIVEAVKQEVGSVFFGEEVEAEVISAAGSLQAARDFFAIDYLNEQNAGVSNAELWTFLNSTSAPGLNDLTAVAETVEGWLSASDSQPAPKDMVSKATSVCLGVYLHICLLHRERAKVAPTTQQAVAETADVVSYGQLAMQRMLTRVMNIITARIACLSYSESYTHEGTQKVARLDDSWFDGGSSTLISAVRHANDSYDPTDVMQRVLHAYRRLLWSGADADYNELSAAIGDPGMLGLGGDFADYSIRDAFVQNSLDGVRAFGKWAAAVRGLLVSIDTLALNVVAQSEEDWHYCYNCGVLYSGTGTPSGDPSVCAAGGEHNTNATGDYAMRSVPLSGTAPSGTQDNWRRCKKCGTLFFAYGAISCPAGGQHDLTGSNDYFLTYGTIPTTLGVPAQGSWNYCRNCGALHFGLGGASVCSGNSGGAHDGTGSNNYWLSLLGTWPGS